MRLCDTTKTKIDEVFEIKYNNVSLYNSFYGFKFQNFDPYEDRSSTYDPETNKIIVSGGNYKFDGSDTRPLTQGILGQPNETIPYFPGNNIKNPTDPTNDALDDLRQKNPTKTPKQILFDSCSLYLAFPIPTKTVNGVTRKIKDWTFLKKGGLNTTKSFFNRDSNNFSNAFIKSVKQQDEHTHVRIEWPIVFNKTAQTSAPNKELFVNLMQYLNTSKLSGFDGTNLSDLEFSLVPSIPYNAASGTVYLVLPNPFAQIKISNCVPGAGNKSYFFNYPLNLTNWSDNKYRGIFIPLCTYAEPLKIFLPFKNNAPIDAASFMDSLISAITAERNSVTLLPVGNQIGPPENLSYIGHHADLQADNEKYIVVIPHKSKEDLGMYIEQTMKKVVETTLTYLSDPHNLKNAISSIPNMLFNEDDVVDTLPDNFDFKKANPCLIKCQDYENAFVISSTEPDPQDPTKNHMISLLNTKILNLQSNQFLNITDKEGLNSFLKRAIINPNLVYTSGPKK